MEQAKQPSSSAEIVLVISNRPGVQGLKRASLAGIQTRVIILLLIMSETMLSCSMLVLVFMLQHKLLMNHLSGC